MSISIFELAWSLLGLELVIFTSILMFQRANISLFGEAGSLLLGFSYFLGGIIYENEKKKSFLAFFRFWEAFKKKGCEKMQFFRILGPRFNFNAKKNAGS